MRRGGYGQKGVGGGHREVDEWRRGRGWGESSEIKRGQGCTEIGGVGGGGQRDGGLDMWRGGGADQDPKSGTERARQMEREGCRWGRGREEYKGRERERERERARDGWKKEEQRRCTKEEIGTGK